MSRAINSPNDTPYLTREQLPCVEVQRVSCPSVALRARCDRLQTTALWSLHPSISAWHTYPHDQRHISRKRQDPITDCLGCFVYHTEHRTLDGGRTSTRYVHVRAHVIAFQHPLVLARGFVYGCVSMESSGGAISIEHCITMLAVEIINVLVACLMAPLLWDDSAISFINEIPKSFCKYLSGVYGSLNACACL